ncbi:hypothetical protein M2318_000517 [Metapseudomonas resinovorans]
MTVLQNSHMQLSPGERAWLPWFGRTGKLAMGWSCSLNSLIRISIRAR